MSKAAGIGIGCAATAFVLFFFLKDIANINRATVPNGAPKSPPPSMPIYVPGRPVTEVTEVKDSRILENLQVTVLESGHDCSRVITAMHLMKDEFGRTQFMVVCAPKIFYRAIFGSARTIVKPWE